ncbi:hypothetical protein APHAL10511_007687 [Amanita phalloides]|nr:hypothetical protein APHAL10511_007687 [Amanita phalloides]
MSRRDTEDTLVEEAIHNVADYYNPESELPVTFHPPLYLQRRLWILDVGCGEGQLLAVLCQPAPWLRPPPFTVLPPSPSVSRSDPSNVPIEEVTYLHPNLLYGLDISDEDLNFAKSNTEPIAIEEASYAAPFRSTYRNHCIRWEELSVKIWKGGFQTINEAFADIECIVSTEVVEHLPPDAFSAYAPTLLGVYHPRLFLITTPSYTFNARFNTPDAPPSARSGYLDPTGRTARILRHEDHKFEWTIDEFEAWCNATAEEWGYHVSTSSVGRAIEKDPWGRDEELGGATQVAVFKRLDTIPNTERERKGKEVIAKLRSSNGEHELLATYLHEAHASSMKSKPLSDIGNAVKAKIEEFSVSFIRLEEIWFERDIAIMCGGWIECLVRAVEECESLRLTKGDGMRKERATWTIELIGATTTPVNLWPTEDGMSEATMVPEDWIPEEDTSAASSECEGSTGNEGDISWGGSEDEDDESERPKPTASWGLRTTDSPIHWMSDAEEGEWKGATKWVKGEYSQEPSSATTAGWEGDKSEDTS